MFPYLAVLALLLILLGHGFLWAAVVNRLHGLALPAKTALRITAVFFAVFLAIPLAIAGWALYAGHCPLAEPFWERLPWPLAWYLLTCVAAAAVTLGARMTRRLDSRRVPVLQSFNVRSLDLADRAWGEASGWVRIPGNESLRLDITERSITLDRLPPALDGLRIVHLTDAHFTGRVDQGYFTEVIRLANELGPDIVAVTGDLIDRPECIDWLPDTFGRLRARYGVYFILGNHDLSTEPPRLRRVLVECGLVDLGGRWIAPEIRGTRVVLAGNELPWFRPAADLAGAPPPAHAGGPLRILLAHSPDQFRWARRHAIDLMLAGHLHGGQVRLPLLGPILSPSLHGVQHASGLFYEPPTVLFVSQGLSSEQPLRLNCRPELAQLVLRAPGTAEAVP